MCVRRAAAQVRAPPPCGDRDKRWLRSILRQLIHNTRHTRIGLRPLTLTSSLAEMASRKPSRNAGVSPFWPMLTVQRDLPRRCASARFALRSAEDSGCCSAAAVTTLERGEGRAVGGERVAGAAAVKTLERGEGRAVGGERVVVAAAVAAAVAAVAQQHCNCRQQQRRLTGRARVWTWCRGLVGCGLQALPACTENDILSVGSRIK